MVGSKAAPSLQYLALLLLLLMVAYCTRYGCCCALDPLVLHLIDTVVLCATASATALPRKHPEAPEPVELMLGTHQVTMEG